MSRDKPNKPPPPAADDPFADDGAWANDPADADLLDPDAWPDDPDLPTLDEGLGLDLEALPPLEGPDRDEEDLDLQLEEVPLEEDLPDLDAPDDEEMALIPSSLTIRLDGRDLPAVFEPTCARTRWKRPDPPGSAVAAVVLEIAGQVLRCEVACERSPTESVILGRDVVVGRFLLRP